MTPALFQRTSSRDSLARNSSADALMPLKSAKSTFKKISCPFEVGCFACNSLIAWDAFSAERVAI